MVSGLVCLPLGRVAGVRSLAGDVCVLGQNTLLSHCLSPPCNGPASQSGERGKLVSLVRDRNQDLKATKEILNNLTSVFHASEAYHLDLGDMLLLPITGKMH